MFLNVYMLCNIIHIFEILDSIIVNLIILSKVSEKINSRFIEFIGSAECDGNITRQLHYYMHCYCFN